MGIFPQLIEKRTRDRTTSGLDALNDFWYGIAGGGTKAGVSVSEKTALKYLTVFSCVSLISGDIARLPLIMYRRLPGNRGKERVADHPLYDLMHDAPNPEMNSHIWRDTTQGHLLLWGNMYAMIDRKPNTGEIRALWLIENPGAVTVKRDDQGRIFYRWINGKGETVTKFKPDVFHIPGFGFNGLTGLSMITLAREAIGAGLAMEEFGSRFFGDGTHPSIAINIPPEIDLGEAEDEYKEKLKKTLAGLKNAHGIAVFANGEKLERFTMPLNDAQFLESRDHQKTEICGMYHVPPHKIALHGANSNYNNLEQENQGYVDSCLSHWVVRWEKCISHQLLTPQERKDGYFFEFLIDGLLRGDSQSRGEFYGKLWQVAGITSNEIRAKENMNPIDGGDIPMVPLNMIPMNKAEDLADSQIDGNNSQGNQRAIIVPLAENRSIIMRDRIIKQYYPLVMRAAEKIVNRESIAIKRQIGKAAKDQAVNSLLDWLHEFYRDMPEYIKREMGPVFYSLLMAIAEIAGDEIGINIDRDNVRRFSVDYAGAYAERHSSSSLGQMMALVDGELSEIETRVDEWSETRPEKIAINETVRGSNAIYQLVAFGAGMATVWRIRGASTCAYCKELNGRKVITGQFFAGAGDELNPIGGTGPMKIRGMKAHPPLHQGCDCYLGVG